MATVALFAAIVAASAGCAGPEWLTLRDTPLSPLAARLGLDSADGPTPTGRTLLALRRYDMIDDLQGDPRKLLNDFSEIVEREPTPENVYVLSELAFVGAKKLEAKGDEHALDMYGVSVASAYRFLFDERYTANRNPYDPQFRWACDLYNGALENAMRILTRNGHLKPGETAQLEACGQSWEITVALGEGSWHLDDFERFEFASDYDVTGLRNHYRSFGLGVPLIAVRRKRPQEDPAEKFYPPDLSVAITAFLHVLPKEGPDGRRHRAALELFDPLVSTDVQVGRRRVPLESDFTTPLAYFLSQPEFNDMALSTTGLLYPDEAQSLRGLYMLEPYDPHKIPVLMVHGLWSSPVTWMEMFNDLRSERAIRERYQFWFYLYPTGQPFWYSAAQMRGDLQRMRDLVDPQRRSAPLDQMVVIGHSMGGLLAQLQTMDSSSDFWHLVSDKSLRDVKTDQETLQGLQRTYFFHPNRSIREVVTIATPHRGSRLANSTTEWLGRKLISLPKRLVHSRTQLEKDNPGLFHRPGLVDVETSIASLAPDTPIFAAMQKAARPRWVTYHNVVGLIPDEGLVGRVAAGSDGVVSFESAHLDDAQSEIVVASDHSHVHTHPRTILQVRRILLDHLGQLQGPGEVRAGWNAPYRWQ